VDNFGHDTPSENVVVAFWLRLEISRVSRNIFLSTHTIAQIAT